MVRIILADAWEVVTDGLRLRLADEPDLSVLGHACDGNALLALVKEVPCDLVVLDVALAGKDGIDTMRALHAEFPELRVLAHSDYEEIEYVNSMLIEGASGYLMKNSDKAELLLAIRTVMAGERYLSPAAAASVEEGYHFTRKRIDGKYIGLTQREKEIIRLIALERTNQEIADALFVSVDTVKSHRKNLMTKLDVRSTAGLVKYAVDRRWI